MLKKESFALVFGLAGIAGLGLYDALKGTGSYLNELVFFMAVYILAYLLYKPLRLNMITYSMLFLTLLLHSLGVFGFYARTPTIVEWDVVTHFFPILFTTILLFNILKPHMGRRLDVHTFLLMMIVFLSALGIGALVENAEFLGFNLYGFGEGGLRFGEGDACPGKEISDSLETHVGGWFDAMWDLVVNFLAALVGTIMMGAKHFWLEKKGVELF